MNIIEADILLANMEAKHGTDVLIDLLAAKFRTILDKGDGEESVDAFRDWWAEWGQIVEAELDL